MIQSVDRKTRTPMQGLAMETPSLIFRFGPFEARTCAQELSKNGTSVRLRGQPFAILDLLVSRAGEVVTREEIRQRIWPVNTSSTSSTG